MKECLACNAKYSTALRNCTSCGASPAVVDGFDAYAPDLAHAGGGFKASYFSELVLLEKGNFWFRARNKMIVWSLKKYAPKFKSLLELGCGTGFVLSGIVSNFPEARLKGSEIFTGGLAFAAERLPTVDLVQMDARHIPFMDEFDVIGAFDVTEHIKEDTIVLRQIHKALRLDGIMLLTVPQHKWLWSAADEYALHERRYSALEINEKVRAAGFKILRSTSFVTTLLPAMLLSRILQTRDKGNFDPNAELKINSIVDSLFEKVLKLELAGIKLGMSYPFGGSRLVVARKV